MRKYAQIYKQKVVFLTETTLTLDEVRKNFGDDAIWLDVTECADVGIGYIQGLDAEGRFKLIPPTVDDMVGLSEKERRAKIMLILMTNLKSKYNKLAMDNGFVSIDDALLATITNEALEEDMSVASSLGEKYYHQRALVRNYFATEHYQYYKGDYQFFRLTDIDKILEDAKPAKVENTHYPDPVPGTPSPADPPNFNHDTVSPTDHLGDDIPELPPVPSDVHEDNDGDIPALPGADELELPELPRENNTVVRPADESDAGIPEFPPTGDGELPPVPETPKPKTPTTLPDGSPLPENAVVDERTGEIVVEDDEYYTVYHPDGRKSVSPKDHL